MDGRPFVIPANVIEEADLGGILILVVERKSRRPFFFALNFSRRFSPCPVKIEVTSFPAPFEAAGFFYGKRGSIMNSFKACRVAHEYTQTNPASPEKVFPLLCPVREADWIPGWRYKLIYSESGVAELGCIFTTEHPVVEWITIR